MSLFLVRLWRIETCTVFEIGKKVGERNATLIGTLAHESIPILVIGNLYAHIVCVIFWNLINTVMRNNCHDFSGKNINDSIRLITYLIYLKSCQWSSNRITIVVNILSLIPLSLQSLQTIAENFFSIFLIVTLHTKISPINRFSVVVIYGNSYELSYFLWN